MERIVIGKRLRVAMASIAVVSASCGSSRPQQFREPPIPYQPLESVSGEIPYKTKGSLSPTHSTDSSPYQSEPEDVAKAKGLTQSDVQKIIDKHLKNKEAEKKREANESKGEKRRRFWDDSQVERRIGVADQKQTLPNAHRWDKFNLTPLGLASRKTSIRTSMFPMVIWPTFAEQELG